MARRLLRYFGIGLLLLALAGLWAFSFFFFNPFEGGYEYAIASLIPRDVHLYAYKKDLDQAFDPFPELVFLEAFQASESGRALEALGLGQMVRDAKVQEAVAEVEANLATLPIQVDPLAFFGGKGLAVAMRYPEGGGQPEWAVYGRTSRLGKLAVELVAGDWIDLQGITVTPFEDGGEELGVQLAGGQLAMPVFLMRLQDVVVVASSGSFLTSAHAFEGTRGQDSLGQAAKYSDNVVRSSRTGEELELYLDREALQRFAPQPWPNPRAQTVWGALVARMFQLGTVRELIGTADPGRTVTLEYVAELVSNALTPFQQRLYEERGFDKDQMLEVASLVPADVGFFGYVLVDVGDLLRELVTVVRALDPAAIDNLEDLVRSAWNYPDIDPLIDDLEAAFRDRVAFFVRNYDFPEDPNGAPHDAVPVPAWGLVLWVEDAAKIDALRAVIHRKDTAEMMGIRGTDGDGNGIWTNTLEGGAVVNEYWNPFIPGTGHVATMEMKGRDSYLVVTNVFRLLGRVFKTYHEGESGGAIQRRLSEDPAFLTWVGSGMGSANLLLWLAPDRVAATSRRVAEFQASESVGDYIDWDVERPRIEKEVIARDFPGEVWGRVSAQNRDSFEMRVEQAVDEFERGFLQENLPLLRAEAFRRLQALEIVDRALVEVATDRKRLQLHGRVGLSFLEP
jgi:hypothetical protein